MAQPIPNDPSLPHHTMTVNLDGVNFDLSFDWNDRNGCYYMDVNDASGNPIFAGICLNVQTPLLQGCVDPRRPAGEFWLVNTKAPEVEAKYGDLGQDCILYYVPAASVPAGVDT